jgi:tRNA pseudouridine13 synthase
MTHTSNTLELAYAHGGPLFHAQIRTQPEDFQVTEALGWEPSGDGEHDFLWIQKTGANTEWVAQRLAEFANVPSKDVGFSGMKDRHAVTQQWFSVPRWHKPSWAEFIAEGVKVLRVERHLRKVRRGAHDANHFRIVLRLSESIDEDAVGQRLQAIQTLGVPNYYGEQRFGRDGGNMGLTEAWAKGKRLSRNKRSLAISSMRSYLFNHALSARVSSGTWNHLINGDKANLQGSKSVFELQEIDAELIERCARMDIHPALSLAGEGSGIEPSHWQKALDKARVAQDSRSLRLKVDDLEASFDEGALTLSFRLGTGAFATSVLRELCRWSQPVL